MNIYQQQAIERLRNWFIKADNWQKDLFCTIWDGSEKGEQLLARMESLVNREYLNHACRLCAKVEFPEELSFSDEDVGTVVLKSISNVQGVGALASEVALSFGSGLTVVYGENGCGKSSYVRILKALENPANATYVLGNVFEENTTPARADVLFSENGDDQPVTWTKGSTQKYPLQIYDNTAAKQFVEKENEVVYEPKILSVVTKMANVYERLSAIYKQKVAGLQQQLVVHQNDFGGSPIINEFNNLATEKDLKVFAKKYPWGDAEENNLVSVVESLKESDPLKAAIAWDTKKGIVRRYGYSILELLNIVDDDACEIYLMKRKKQIETKKVQDELIAASKEQSLLQEFGGNVWRSMWTQANTYINLIESGGRGIPVSQTDRCALCQQELDDLAKARMQSFKEFCDSKAMADAQVAYRDFQKTVSVLQERIENAIDLVQIKESMMASNLPSDIQETILSAYSQIMARCTWLLGYDETNPAGRPVLQTKEAITKTFKTMIDKMEVQIAALKTAGTNREQQLVRKNDLAAIKWTSSVLPIKQQIINLNRIVANSKTNAITSLKKDLSRLLITDAYVHRFKTEMGYLDAKKQIKVELVEASPKRGKSYHQISLRGAKSIGKHKNGEILSEGEFRVVSLAAFLADLSSWGKIMPFVFDDPITSLDQKYEACVAKRLVELSLERQVIVFTHRLAFAQLLNHEATQFNIRADRAGDTVRASIENIELRKNPLGYPEPPAFLKDISLVKATKQLLAFDIPAIKKAQKNGQFTEADQLTRTLCSDFRKVVEQGIGQDLLSGIVSRFGREIFSLKLPRLYAMTQEDIALFDEMMTKYSYQEHSQPVETPIDLPDIADIEADVKKMQDWAKEYNKRCDDKADKARGKKLAVK